jgi:hypothetical protein
MPSVVGSDNSQQKKTAKEIRDNLRRQLRAHDRKAAKAKKEKARDELREFGIPKTHTSKEPSMPRQPRTPATTEDQREQAQMDEALR